MPPQVQGPDQPGPDSPRRSRRDRAMSNRERRRVEAEQAERRKRYAIIGGAVAVALVVGLVLVLLNRPQPAGSPVLVADPLPASIPLDGKVMGAADAPVTVVEWGDYT